MAGDVAAMLTETLEPMLKSEPASVIAGTCAFLAVTAKHLAGGDENAAIAMINDLHRSMLWTVVGKPGGGRQRGT